jgi:hypothetical protein
MTMCTSIVKSVARQSRNQKIGYFAQRRKGAKIKMSCHFDRREKSFLDPWHLPGMTGWRLALGDLARGNPRRRYLEPGTLNRLERFV